MTGFEINLELYWTGSIGEWSVAGGSDVECFIIIHGKKGYHSFGSDPTYLDYGSVDPKSGVASKVLHDRYMRGIKFSFSQSGSIREFFFLDFVLQCAAFFVYLAMAPTITSIVFNSIPWFAKKSVRLQYASREQQIWK